MVRARNRGFARVQEATGEPIPIQMHLSLKLAMSPPKKAGIKLFSSYSMQILPLKLNYKFYVYKFVITMLTMVLSRNEVRAAAILKRINH